MQKYLQKYVDQGPTCTQKYGHKKNPHLCFLIFGHFAHGFFDDSVGKTGDILRLDLHGYGHLYMFLAGGL